MSRFYGIGEDGLASSAMEDAGETSSWYVFDAIGLYPYSPADPEYRLGPALSEDIFKLNDAKTLTILKKNSGERTTSITCGGR
jgi:putative alpha-1,2-mannosidase